MADVVAEGACEVAAVVAEGPGVLAGDVREGPGVFGSAEVMAGAVALVVGAGDRAAEAVGAGIELPVHPARLTTSHARSQPAGLLLVRSIPHPPSEAGR